MLPRITNQAIFIFFISVSVFILYLLTPILTPFLLGALLAYLSDPLVKRLEKWHVSHLLSVICVFLMLLCAFLLLILMIVPLLQNQITAFLDFVPQVVTWLQMTAIPWITEYVKLADLKATVSAKSTLIFNTVLHSGYTLIDIVISIVLTPVVTFYLLRDWDSILKSIKDALPKSIKPTVLKLTRECDEVLGAFFRGQLLVMLSLSLIYGIGLTLVGLQAGFVIGLIGGLLSIVPFLGSGFVVIVATITALVQFSGALQPVLWVLVVYMIGQFIEGYVLTPYLVGNRIGLHPVAVIFAIMAGGSLFGFFGVLVALPVAAVIMVILRFIKERNPQEFKKATQKN